MKSEFVMEKKKFIKALILTALTTSYTYADTNIYGGQQVTFEQIEMNIKKSPNKNICLENKQFEKKDVNSGNISMYEFYCISEDFNYLYTSKPRSVFF